MKARIPSFQTRHAAAQARGDFGPYRHPLPVIPPARTLHQSHPDRAPLPLWLAVAQVLACVAIGAAGVAAVILLREFTR